MPKNKDFTYAIEALRKNSFLGTLNYLMLVSEKLISFPG